VIFSNIYCQLLYICYFNIKLILKAIESSKFSFFINIHNASFISRSKQLCLSNHLESDIYMNFFFTITDTITSKNIEFSLESPCTIVGRAWVDSSVFIPTVYKPFMLKSDGPWCGSNLTH